MALMRTRSAPSSFILTIILFTLLLLLIHRHSASSYNDNFYSYSASPSQLSSDSKKAATSKDNKEDERGTGRFLGSLMPTNRTFFNPFSRDRSRGKDDKDNDNDRDSNRQHPVSHPPLKSNGIDLPAFCEICGPEDTWCRRYGAHNLARSHAYTGSAHRFRQLILSVLRGEKTTIKLGILGGSVTLGHAVRTENTWPVLFGAWLEGKLIEITGRKDIRVQVQNGAVNAVESNYFTTCWKEHLDEDLDLVVIEMAINDRRFEVLAEAYEFLLRGLLELPSKPAVLNLHVMALAFERITTGGDLHTPVAEYYDTPIISLRNMLLPHLLANPSLSPAPLPPNPRDKSDEQHFTLNNLEEYWFVAHSGGVDLRHMNTNGHALMSDLLAAWSERTMCTALKQHKEVKAGKWDGPYKASDNITPGDEVLDYIPRLRLFDKYDRTTVRAPVKPTCMTITSKKHPLKAYKTNGWSIWSPPQRPDKLYWRSNVPGSRITFEIITGGGLGEVSVTYLRSKTFGMGSVWVWKSTPGEKVDVGGKMVEQDEDNMRPWGMRMDAWWDVDGMNTAGPQVAMRDVKPGRHLLHLEIIPETKDPGGGHDFRITAVDAS